MLVRPALEVDSSRILTLNLESEWAMSPLDEESLDELLAMSAHVLVADDAGSVVGFAIALLPGAPYESANYRWFAERYEDFLYLDRIAVSGTVRRRGVGTALYEAMEERALPRGRMLCEVNLVPRNDVSLAFHSARGYGEVGTLEHGDDDKVVVMLEKSLGG